ncbi:hypothetical protein KJF94_23285 [Pseudomonas hormoni]|uniref:Uncharacterized protein n=1 Tax=Pseudomonas hormoni TaxID=3093767 RepID=A0ABX8EUB9_9PSED|nr:hypothetical protein [Pseudomonas hormoni]QVW22746.1 hypothetical protein KJF94_23285 [Pseudomonas hormoni]
MGIIYQNCGEELAPARLRSSRNYGKYGFSESPLLPIMGLLRSPAGASSLATLPAFTTT